MTEGRNGACVHHWVLGAPEDEVVRGRCKRCGAVREYPASVDLAVRQTEDAPPAAVAAEIASAPSLVGATA